MTRANKVWTLALSCCLFFAIGINSATLGAVLPYLAKNTGSSLGTTGSVVSAFFLGALIAQFAVGPIDDRVGPAPVLVASMLLAGIGLVVVSLSPSLMLTLVFMFVAGMGSGAIIVATNVMLAVVFPLRSVAALNFSNVFYGVGAICGPALSSLIAQRWGSTLPIMWVTAGVMGVLVPGALLLRVPRAVHTEAETVEVGVTGVSVYRSPALWAMAGVLLIYVGTEAGTSSWAITYLNRAAGVVVDVAALAVSGFYVALTVGRLLGALVGTWLGGRNLVTLSLMGAAAGALMLMLSGGNAGVMVGALALFGFALGPIYPTVVSLAATTFVEGPGKAASFVMAMGSVGGIVIPWLLGALLEWSGTYGSITLLVGCVLGMLALHLGAGIVRGRVSRIRDQKHEA